MYSHRGRRSSSEPRATNPPALERPRERLDSAKKRVPSRETSSATRLGGALSGYSNKSIRINIFGNRATPGRGNQDVDRPHVESGKLKRSQHVSEANPQSCGNIGGTPSQRSRRYLAEGSNVHERYSWMSSPAKEPSTTTSKIADDCGSWKLNAACTSNASRSSSMRYGSPMVGRQRAPSPSSSARHSNRHNPLSSTGNVLAESSLSSRAARSYSPAFRDSLGSERASASTSLARVLSDRMESMDMSSSSTIPKARLSNHQGATTSLGSSSGMREHRSQQRSSLDVLLSLRRKSELSDLGDSTRPKEGSQASGRAISSSQPNSRTPEDSSRHTNFTLGPGTGTCGLWNLGNTCYQNATLQILVGIPELVDYFHLSQEWKKGVHVSKDFGALVNEMWSKPHRALVHPDAILKKMSKIEKRWGRRSQEDANEFLMAILGALQDDCNRNTSKPKYKCLEERRDIITQADEAWEYSCHWHNSFIDDFFGFQLHSMLTCPICNQSSNTFDYATELEIPIPEGGRTTLEKCLGAFAAPEQLSPQNEWYCSKCQSHVQATKKLSVYRMPRVFLVSLKRFSAGAFHGFHAWKNACPVLMDVNPLDFTPAFSPASPEPCTKFSIWGIVDHSGSTTGGHYTARVKNPKNHRWYNFNDSEVREIAGPSGYDSSTYTLVLRRS